MSEQAQPTRFEISADLINKIAEYLVEKPYKETAPLINEIQKNLKPIFDKPAEVPVDKPDEMPDKVADKPKEKAPSK